ncbi:MAG TPA: spore cortex biosynthesis protein YabQ [Limnochordia bacterium]|nr:spore cortex biosynthesis protein YabQ [Limnochordia bacterium]
MMSLASQLMSFGFIIIAGGICGACFDVYRVVRSVCRPRSAVAVIFDLVFWLAITPILFALLVFSNWAALRFYVLIGIGLGLIVYFQVASALVLWVLVGLVEGLRRCLGLFGGLLVGMLAAPMGAARGFGRPGGFFRGGFHSRRPPRRFW